MFLIDCYAVIQIMFLSEVTVFISSCLNMYTTLFGRRQVCRWAATLRKNTNREKGCQPIKKPIGENWWVGFSHARCLRRLFTHDDDDRGGGDGVMITMLMMDDPHCPWVIYNDLCGAIQWS